MTHSNQSISPLRQRMIDDMTLRKLAPKTQAAYLRAVIKFTLFFGQSPDLASPEDLRRFQLHLVNEGTSATTINATLTGLGFLFGATLERPDALKRTSRVRKPQRLPHVLSVEEVARLLAGANNRYAMLSPSLLELLRAWWRHGHTLGKMRPGGWLFPGCNPVNPMSTRQLNKACHAAAQAAGLEQRVSMHTLRHSFATHLPGLRCAHDHYRDLRKTIAAGAAG